MKVRPIWRRKFPKGFGGVQYQGTSAPLRGAFFNWENEREKFQVNRLNNAYYRPKEV